MANGPVRIAHIIGKLNKGGVEAVVNNYYRFIDREKYQFDFFVDSDGMCEPPQENIALGARYFTIPPYQRLPAYLRSLVRLFRENRYSVVHSGMNTLSVFSLFAARIAGVGVRICHIHSTASAGETKVNILKYMLRPFARVFATQLCACSRHSGEWMYGKRLVSDGRVTVFNNAIDPEKYAFDPQLRSEVRRELGLEGKFVVGHVGRFCFAKNHGFLIRIFEEVRNKDSDAVLLLVGAGELMEEVREQVRNSGLQDAVLFAGVRDDVERLYQAMDVFLMPSVSEGLPVVGVEAQAAGLPCILSDRITEDVVVIPETKRMSLEQTPAEWADAVCRSRLLPRRDTRGDVRKAGFDIRQEAKKLEAYYDACLAK